MLATIQELASDAYEGRLPGTEGENKSVAYLVSQCKAIGLTPGNPDGTYKQMVPLWGTRSKGTIEFTAGGQAIPLTAGADYVAWTARPEKVTDIQHSPLVFGGYGAVAPEYDWDDYKGVDLKGKTIFLLAGDPPTADESKFQGKALSFYGRSGTKMEAAFKHGAAAIISIAAPNPARAYSFSAMTRENMVIREASAAQRTAAQGAITYAKADELFKAAGQDLAQLRASAAKQGFRAVALKADASFHIETVVRKIDSANIIAKVPGTDPKLKNEYVFYSGHWDHHGRDGDQIFHGASDNAAGTAGVLELARAMKAKAPKRTVVFLWPTAEEKGLLGAKWYVDHPLYPLKATVADINLDYFSNWGWGRTKDFSIVGLGNSTLDDLTAKVVNAQGRELTGDTLPEQGFYFRSDHYEFARVGVPSLETSPGIQYIGKPAGYGEEKRNHYIRTDYHQASDVVKPDWDLSGAVEDLNVLLEVGYEVAQSDKHPEWKPDAKWRPK